MTRTWSHATSWPNDVWKTKTKARATHTNSAHGTYREAVTGHDGDVLAERDERRVAGPEELLVGRALVELPDEEDHGGTGVLLTQDGELGVEAGPNLEERAKPAEDLSSAHRRSRDAREDLQQRALPRAVGADDAEHFAALDFERHVAERPELGAGLH